MSTATAAPGTEAHHALPVGLRLGEFEIRSVLGVGGFGIVYHAFDHALERDVAIKEYMPSSMAARSEDTLHVSLLSQGHAETFTLGLKSFVNEARLLARFDHPSLVKVHRFWEANGTAYMVMPLYRGRTLKALRLAAGRAPDEAWLRALLEPLLGALDALHAEGVFHRDIAPDNIMIGPDGKPVLLDFGAARRVIGDASQALTAILKPSYAPVEQYAEANGLRQGPWTDVYALGATLSFAVTGVAPQPATARALGANPPRLAAQAAPGVSAEFLHLIDWMMAPRPEQRPQNVAALREVLDGRSVAPRPPAAPASLPSPGAWEHTVVQDDDAPEPHAVKRRADASRAAAKKQRRARRRAVLLAALAVACALAAIATWLWAAPAVHEVEPVIAPAAPAAVVVNEPPAAASAASPPAPVPAATELASAAVTPSAARPPLPRRAAVAAPEAQGGEPLAGETASPTASTATPRLPLQGDEAAPSTAAAAPTAALLRPRDQCQGRALLALHRCLKRVCQDPAVSQHLDCRRMRQVEAANARPNEH